MEVAHTAHGGGLFLSKQAARIELERRRRALSLQEVESKGVEARKRLLALTFFRGVIATYAPQSFELPPPRGLLPYVHPGSKKLTFHEMRGLLTSGPLGIATPSADWPKRSDIDVFVIPGVGFSGDGTRLGRGKGYYDATLIDFPTSIKIGFTFDCCVVAELPSEKHDVKMDWIVTESRTLQMSYCAARSAKTQL